MSSNQGVLLIELDVDEDSLIDDSSFEEEQVYVGVSSKLESDYLLLMRYSS